MEREPSENPLRRLYEQTFGAVYAHASARAQGAQRTQSARLDRQVQQLYARVLVDRGALTALFALDEADRAAHLSERLDPAAEASAHDEETCANADVCVRPAASGWVDNYFKGRLSPADEPALWRHLDQCPACNVRYHARWLAEGEGSAAVPARRARLGRSLPWSEAAAIELEGLAAGDAGADSTQSADAELESDADALPPAAESKPRRWDGIIALAVALALAVLGVTLMLRLDPSPGGQPEKDVKSDLDPDRGLTVTLFRYDDTDRFEEPWRLVQESVASGERILLTYALDRGVGPHLAILAVWDSGKVSWLLPAAGLGARPPQSARVTVPSQGVRLKAQLRVPESAARLVIYGIASVRPLPLKRIQDALKAVLGAPDFTTHPPRLALEKTVQYRIAVDVIR